MLQTSHFAAQTGPAKRTKIVPAGLGTNSLPALLIWMVPGLSRKPNTYAAKRKPIYRR